MRLWKMKVVTIILTVLLLLGAGCAPVEPESSAGEPVEESSAAESSEDEVSVGASEDDSDSEEELSGEEVREVPIDPASGWLDFSETEYFSEPDCNCVRVVWLDDDSIAAAIRPAGDNFHLKIVTYDFTTGAERLIWEGSSEKIQMDSDGEYLYYAVGSFLSHVYRCRLSDWKTEEGTFLSEMTTKENVVRRGWFIAPGEPFTVTNVFTGEQKVLPAVPKRGTSHLAKGNAEGVEWSPTGEHYLVYSREYNKSFPYHTEVTIFVSVYDRSGDIVLPQRPIKAQREVTWVWAEDGNSLHFLLQNQTDDYENIYEVKKLDIHSGNETVFTPPDSLSLGAETQNGMFRVSPQGDFYLYRRGEGTGIDYRTLLCRYDIETRTETVIYDLSGKAAQNHFSVVAFSPNADKIFCLYERSRSHTTPFDPLLIELTGLG